MNSHINRHKKKSNSNNQPTKVEEQVASTISVEKSNVKIALLPIDELKPHELGSPIYLELLKQEIIRDGVLKYPIIADEKTHVILDGMHRWLVLKSLGCKLIPVILVNALDNSNVRVGRRRIHRYIDDLHEHMNEEQVISAGRSGRLMKPRSTRHFFSFSRFQRVNYPISELNKDTTQDISKYLAKMDAEECKQAIEEWLDEITEELEFLTKRKEEVEREKEEFLSRIKCLNCNLLNP